MRDPLKCNRKFGSRKCDGKFNRVDKSFPGLKVVLHYWECDKCKKRLGLNPAR